MRPVIIQEFLYDQKYVKENEDKKNSAEFFEKGRRSKAVKTIILNFKDFDMFDCVLF